MLLLTYYQLLYHFQLLRLIHHNELSFYLIFLLLYLNHFEYLFGEDQARYIIEIEKENFDKIKEILDKSSVHYDMLGIITESDIFIDSKSKVTIDELISSNTSWLINYMNK